MVDAGGGIVGGIGLRRLLLGRAGSSAARGTPHSLLPCRPLPPPERVVLPCQPGRQAQLVRGIRVGQAAHHNGALCCRRRRRHRAVRLAAGVNRRRRGVADACCNREHSVRAVAWRNTRIIKAAASAAGRTCSVTRGPRPAAPACSAGRAPRRAPAAGGTRAGQGVHVPAASLGRMQLTIAREVVANPRNARHMPPTSGSTPARNQWRELFRIQHATAAAHLLALVHDAVQHQGDAHVLRQRQGALAIHLGQHLQGVGGQASGRAR